MALTSESGKGGTAANVCIIIILMVSSFVAGLLVDNSGGGFPPIGNGNGNTTPTTTTGTTTTSPTTTNPTTTTPVTTLPDPPPDTTYKFYLRIYYTNAMVFSVYTEGTVVLLDVTGIADDTWIVVGMADESELIGISPVKRHTVASTIGKSIIFEVASLGWAYEVDITASWVRTPEGIGDYLQTFALDPSRNLEAQLWLSPRWTG